MNEKYKVSLISPERICPREFIPSGDDFNLQLLTKNIRRNGITVPLIVCKNGEDKYKIIDGDRRLTAAKASRLKYVPCIVTSDSENTDFLRAELSLFSESPDYFKLCEELSRATVNSGTSPEKTAEKLGVSVKLINKKLKLLRLDENIINRIRKANIPEHIARALLTLPSDKRESALDKIIAEDLNRFEVDKLIKNMLSPEKKPPERKGAISDMKLFDNTLCRMVYTLNLSGMKASFTVTDKGDTTVYKISVKKSHPPLQSSFAELL